MKTIAASIIALTMGFGGVCAAAQLDNAWNATKQAGKSMGADGTKHTAKTQKAAIATCNRRGGLAR